MSAYTRRGFAQRLARIPDQDKPFCKKGTCPIATLYKLKPANGATPNQRALELDKQFANAVDSVAAKYHAWDDITPRIARVILKTLEAVAA